MSACSRLAALLLALLVTGAAADERILDFDSDVSVQPDGSLAVTETIRVRAEGDQIRRGIIREFPTRYRDRLGQRVHVRFQFVGASRDGDPENWRVEDYENGVRIYLGRADHFLDPGVYTYQLRFRANRLLRYGDEGDELYWNATGTGWPWPIERASATIRVPGAVARDQWELNAYTGRQGERGQAARSEVIDERTVHFETTAPLPSRAGLTVSAIWPGGIVSQPSTMQELRWLLADNLALLIAALGLAGVLAWYVHAWRSVGRDPRKGTIIPRFEPPAGLSPAACRYVEKMGLDNTAFSAALISLGVKGHVAIEEEKKKTFTVERRDGGRVAPSAGEKALLDALFRGGKRRVELDQDEHSRFMAARSGLESALAREYKGELFRLNVIYAIPAALITAATLAVSFLVAGIGGLWVLVIVATLLLHALFIWLLRAPTVPGRAVLDEIEGLRMYLDTAEQERLERMRAPALTPEVFETFLPYAHALGVANSWSDRFRRELPEAVQQDYQPAWYHGRFQGIRGIDHLGSNFGSSFSSAIASASTPPGSSSGGGGSGFSGGGGGGGGGGGW